MDIHSLHILVLLAPVARKKNCIAKFTSTVCQADGPAPVRGPRAVRVMRTFLQVMLKNVGPPVLYSIIHVPSSEFSERIAHFQIPPMDQLARPKGKSASFRWDHSRCSLHAIQTVLMIRDLSDTTQASDPNTFTVTLQVVI